MPEVVAIGAANVDLIAAVHRFPNPDDEVAVKKLEIFGGGSSANVAVGVARLGHSAGFVGLIGTDSFGDFLVKEFERDGVDISRAKRVEGTSGIVFAAVKQDGERVLYTSEGVASRFSKEHIPVDYVRKSKFVHLTSVDSEGALEAFELAARTAKGSGARVIFDPGCIFAEKGMEALMGVARHCFIIKMNKVESNMLTGHDDIEAAKKLLSAGAENIIITKGLDGCIVAGKNGIRRMPFVPKVKVKAIDLTGAGDSFSAGLIAALLEGRDLDFSVDFAMQIGSISAGKKGARGTPKRKEIENLFA